MPRVDEEGGRDHIFLALRRQPLFALHPVSIENASCMPTQVKQIIPEGCPRARIRATAKDSTRLAEWTIRQSLGDESRGMVVLDFDGLTVQQDKRNKGERLLRMFSCEPRSSTKVRSTRSFAGRRGEGGGLCAFPAVNTFCVRNVEYQRSMC